MFFTEARRLLDDPSSYTIEIAHHQVQAIRLMPYEPKDEDEIRIFIKKCPDFNVAYKHLQKLTKERMERVSYQCSCFKDQLIKQFLAYRKCCTYSPTTEH